MPNLVALVTALNFNNLEAAVLLNLVRTHGRANA